MSGELRGKVVPVTEGSETGWPRRPRQIGDQYR